MHASRGLPGSPVPAVLVALLLGGCFGHDAVWSEDPSRVLTVGVGQNRYIYAMTVGEKLPPLEEPATALSSQPPEGYEEVGFISLDTQLGGFGAGGLRRSESEFHPECAQIAARMGGTHFYMTKVIVTQGFITSATIPVLVEK